MFEDRAQAGAVLAKVLLDYAIQSPFLLGVPRGGIVVAEPIAKALNAPLDVLVTRKIGHPNNPEVAIGAVMPDGSTILDKHAIERFHISEEDLSERIRNEFCELKRRLLIYTNRLEPPIITGRSAVIIDDGIATGYTIRAAIQWLRAQKPSQIIVAVPVAPPDVAASLRHEVDAFVCPLQPSDFMAVGMYYKQFSQTSDAEVIAILRNAPGGLDRK